MRHPPFAVVLPLHPRPRSIKITPNVMTISTILVRLNNLTYDSFCFLFVYLCAYFLEHGLKIVSFYPCSFPLCNHYFSKISNSCLFIKETDFSTHKDCLFVKKSCLRRKRKQLFPFYLISKITTSISPPGVVNLHLIVSLYDPLMLLPLVNHLK